jgi:hypothetical protein
MKSLTSILFRRRMIAALAAFFMLISLSYASISFARNRAPEKTVNEKTPDDYCFWWHSRVYYTDATYTTSTATRVWFCDGLVGQGGQATPYYQDFYCECFPEGEGGE